MLLLFMLIAWKMAEHYSNTLQRDKQDYNIKTNVLCIDGNGNRYHFNII